MLRSRGDARLSHTTVTLTSDEKRRIQAILDTLERLYPDADCELRYDTPFQLLVATVLSAQSTDKRVNMVTERLFKEYGTPEAMAALEPEELEPWIKELGLYRNKARQIVHAARMIVEEHGGQVPSERSALEALPGVGRKTANVVLSNAFSIPALAVDTHVFRVARRLGLAVTKSPEQTERVLTQILPKESWKQVHHRLIRHGRQVCTARNPACFSCELRLFCPSAQAPDDAR
ncbi:MAG: endonuclease III [Firmicutes bacterium]|nr:endonuclease III [Bacillota bacterium]